MTLFQMKLLKWQITLFKWFIRACKTIITISIAHTSSEVLTVSNTQMTQPNLLSLLGRNQLQYIINLLQPVEIVDNFRYLGIILDNKLSFDHHDRHS